MPYIKWKQETNDFLAKKNSEDRKISAKFSGTHQGDLMGKYLIYGVIILVALFILNWFKIVNIPLFDIPDFTESKQEMISNSQSSLKQLE